MTTSELPSRRRIWPLALILLAACGGVIAYSKWVASANPNRLERLVREALLDDINGALQTPALSLSDIQISNLKRQEILPGLRHHFSASGTVTVPRKPFAGMVLNAGPVYRPEGEAKFEFIVYGSDAPEPIAIARQLGAIRPTLRINAVEAYVKSKDADGPRLDVHQPFTYQWNALDQPDASDLFDIAILLSPRSPWHLELMPDSYLAIYARVLRMQGDTALAAALLADLTPDAPNAPLVQEEVDQLLADLSPDDPLALRIKQTMSPPP